MTRHAKNCTAGAVYTNNERKRDANESGYGTNAKRVGKDSIKSFDCCCLSLQPCRNPVITKDGYLFDKEAILTYIIKKKNDFSRKLKEYERLRKSEASKQAEASSSKQEKICNNFVDSHKAIFENPTNSNKSNDDDSAKSISNMAGGYNKKLPSFWLPSEGPNAVASKIEKPDPVIYCPVSGKPLKVKDLIDVKFTLLKDGDKSRSIIAKEARYMCPVTHDVLSNAIPCAVLRPTGDVVTMECVEKLIKKDMIHPLTNQKLKPSDIIVLQRGGTGFATTNTNLEGKEKRPMMQC